jgi:hypothetical protein
MGIQGLKGAYYWCEASYPDGGWGGDAGEERQYLFRARSDAAAIKIAREKLWGLPDGRILIRFEGGEKIKRIDLGSL